MAEMHCERCGYDYPSDYSQTRFGAPVEDGPFVVDNVCGYCVFVERNTE